MFRWVRLLVAFMILAGGTGIGARSAKASPYPSYHIHNVYVALLSVATHRIVGGYTAHHGKIYLVGTFNEYNVDDIHSEIARGDIVVVLPGGTVIGQSKIPVAHDLTRLVVEPSTDGDGVLVWEVPATAYRAKIRWTPAVRENKNLTYPVYSWEVTFKAPVSTAPPVRPASRPPATPRPASTKAPAHLSVKVGITPNPVVYDGYPTVMIKTAPGASCDIKVVYSTGRQPTSYREHMNQADNAGYIVEQGSWHVQTAGDSGVATAQCSVGDMRAQASIAFDVVQQ